MEQTQCCIFNIAKSNPDAMVLIGVVQFKGTNLQTQADASPIKLLTAVNYASWI